MSEFSESFHLKTDAKNEGKKLLKSIGVNGIVFEETNGWVTVIHEGELNSQISPMSSYNGIIVHYMYAEDHAWMLNVFYQGNSVCNFVCAWDPEIHIEDKSLNFKELSKLIVSYESLQEFEELFSLNEIEKIFKVNPAYTFAKLIGLEHYKWLSGQNIIEHSEEIIKNNTGAELIKA